MIIAPPAAGDGDLKPRVSLAPGLDASGNSIPGFGVEWPATHDNDLEQSVTPSTPANPQCGWTGEAIPLSERLLGHLPLDPNGGAADVTRTTVSQPVAYGPPRCDGSKCLTRVSGVDGFDDAPREVYSGAAQVRTTWWFDIETCYGC